MGVCEDELCVLIFLSTAMKFFIVSTSSYRAASCNVLILGVCIVVGVVVVFGGVIFFVVV